MHTCIVLQAKGTTRATHLPAAGGAGGGHKPFPQLATDVLRRTTVPEAIGTWSWRGFVLHLLGYKTGKTGTNNKHEVPPPHDNVPLFGDAVILATRDGDLASFAAADYTKFYNETLSGLDDAEADDGDGDESESDEEGDAEAEADAEAEGEEEAGDESSDSDSEPDIAMEEEEEEKPVRIPVPRVIKQKRTAKKCPAWMSIPELERDLYGAAGSPVTVTTREIVRRVISARCTFLTEDEQIDFERGIFNFTLDEAKRRNTRRVWENPEFAAIYDIAARRCVANLDGSSYINNGRLLTRLRDGEFAPHDVPYMTYAELYPEKWAELMELAVKREAKMLEVDKSMATDMFKCTRCGKRQCTYYEMQTRSADEPMTQFIRCLNCGKQWRQ